MTPEQFIEKWRKSELTERAASQSHFNDLCALLGHKTPTDADPKGEWFAFDKGVEKRGGGDGFADVWMKEHFGWEYKGKHKNLDAAYEQLLLYREDLENPPLLVVCDMEQFVIHTNFTSTKHVVHEIPLLELDKPENLQLLRNVFENTEALKPTVTIQGITEEAARKVAEVALAIRSRGIEAHTAARFLDRIVFCLFAEDIRLLPAGIFTQILDRTKNEPARFGKVVGQLFDAMATGGNFGADTIRHFNGNLFSDANVLSLTKEEIARIAEAAALDWSAIDASIFGTLFERGLDPEKRAQLGAHYTSRTDIETIIEPVIIQSLRKEWGAVRETVVAFLATAVQEPTPPKNIALTKEAALEAGKEIARSKRVAGQARTEAEKKILDFLGRLRGVRVLDPACGSGNFLYVTLQKLLELEKTVNRFLAESGFTSQFPQVSPLQLYGIEINSYAHDLAQMTVLIGYIQWLNANGYGHPPEPILQRLDKNFFCMDAILDLSDPANPKEPDWPTVEFIVSNPPFLGGKKLREGLSDECVDKLFQVWKGRVAPEGDLCCYWFEKARAQIEAGRCKRAGLLATQGIRGGANREVLKHIKESGDIFFAESDRDWVLDGASVHVSMIGFDDGSESNRQLDKKPVTRINPNLSDADADITKAVQLVENRNIGFMGDTKVGPFEIPESLAREMLTARNPNGKPNSDVVRPWANGLDITREPQRLWIIDFPPGMTEAEAALYEKPFEYIREHVKPFRAKARSGDFTGVPWWIHQRPRRDMREAINLLPRFIVTPCVSKHRVFVWLQNPTLPDHALIAFARDDDYFFGVLHSRAHEAWSLKLGTRLETRPRYTPTTCFETFPLPEATPAQRDAIAVAAKELNDQRNNWLGDRTDKKRTLTILYNQKPAWLTNAHRKLDETVAAAYGWPADLSDEQILERLLALNLERAKMQEAKV